MSEMVKIWLAEMLHREIEEVNGTISNNRLWLHSSETAGEVDMFSANIESLEEYKTLLLTMQRKVEEGTFNV